MHHRPAETVFEHWLICLGDAGWIAWIVTVGYFIAAALCVVVASRSAGNNPLQLRQRRCWAGLSILMLVLGINKQLDLQMLALFIGQNIAHREGWYNDRRILQEISIAVIAVLVVATIIWIWRLFREAPASLRLAAAGVITLAGYVLVRAMSFHHVDRLLRIHLMNLTLSHLIELVGVILVACAATMNLAHRDHLQNGTSSSA